MRITHDCTYIKNTKLVNKVRERPTKVTGKEYPSYLYYLGLNGGLIVPKDFCYNTQQF